LTEKQTTEKVTKSRTTFTVVAVFSADQIWHNTFPTLEDLNKFIKDEIEAIDETALVFVTKGRLMPESEWRLQEQDKDIQYWTVI
jgi:hypothetical protein